MKSNMDYLKEFIEGNEEALEFWDAVTKEIADLKDEVSDLESVNDQLEDKDDQIQLLKDTLDGLIDEDDLEVIDCGIGKIKYISDNLKLQSFMEDLKEKLEHKAKFGVLPETVEL